MTSENRGVLALGTALINLCYNAFCRADVFLLLGSRDNRPALFRVAGVPTPIPVVHCRLSPRSRLRDHLLWIVVASLAYRLCPFARIRRVIARSTPWIDAVSKSDFIGDVRGGDSFSDIYGIRRFLLGFSMSWAVILVNRRFVFFPQTYGPYKSVVARLLAGHLLRRAFMILARDRQSGLVVQELIGPRSNIICCPDVAFSLEPADPGTIHVEPPSAQSVPSGLIGINVNGLMYRGGYTRDNMFGLTLDYVAFLPLLLTTLLAETPGEIWLVPHTFAPDGDVESDPEASRLLRDALSPELRARVRIVSHPYDPSEIKWIIGRCDFFIGSRMHACIAAISQGIPAVGVAYSRKFAGVFESVGMEEWIIDGRSATSEHAVNRILELYRSRAEVRDRLQKRAADARNELQQVFARLAADIDMTNSCRPA